MRRSRIDAAIRREERRQGNLGVAFIHLLSKHRRMLRLTGKHRRNNSHFASVEA